MKFETPIKHPSGDIKMSVICESGILKKSLDLGSNFASHQIEMIFKAVSLDDLSPQDRAED